MNKLKRILLALIANGSPVVMNLYLNNGLHINNDKTKEGLFYYKVEINRVMKNKLVSVKSNKQKTCQRLTSSEPKS